MIPREVRAVVFDAVGTLIHPDPPAPVVYAEVGRRWGSQHRREEIAARFDAAFRRQEELDEKAGWRTSEVREYDRWRAIVGDVLDDVKEGDVCFQELFAHFGRPTAWRCDPDAAAVLGHLAGDGLFLALASNYDGRLRQVVVGRPELASVSQIMTSSELGWRKPAKEFFVAVCKRLGLSPAEVLYVGNDRANDYIGATTAGLHALLLDPVDRSSEDAKRIASLVELME